MLTQLFDRSKIAARRNPVSSIEGLLGTTGVFKCSYCNHTYKSEAVFMKHECREKRRALELTTPKGQLAFQLYNEWMRVKKFGAQSAVAFLASKFYQPFINFADLVQRASISDTSQYIKLMVDGGHTPYMWCRDQHYSIYLNWVDKEQPPLDQVENSVAFLIQNVCNTKGVNTADVFDHISEDEMVGYIRLRKLSPWLLLMCRKFTNKFKTYDIITQKTIDAIIQTKVWIDKLNEDKNRLLIVEIRAIVSGFNL